MSVYCVFCLFFFKKKTAYEMRISDWSSDVCSSDLVVMYAVVAWGSVRRSGECMTARMTVSACAPPAAMSAAPANRAARTSFSMEIPLSVDGTAVGAAAVAGAPPAAARRGSCGGRAGRKSRAARCHSDAVAQPCPWMLGGIHQHPPGPPATQAGSKTEDGAGGN